MADGPLRTLLSADATTRLVRALYGLCALLAALGIGYQLFGHAFDHAHFGVERWPVFYGAYGFVAFVVIVYLGRLLRALVARREDYYRPSEPERSK